MKECLDNFKYLSNLIAITRAIYEIIYFVVNFNFEVTYQFKMFWDVFCVKLALF